MDSLQIQDILRLLAGAAGTWLGAELLVRGSARLAVALGLRPLLVGLTVVAFGTSSPEAVVSFVAAADGLAGLAVGNVVGSNIANIGLILGLVCLVHPMRVNWIEVRRDVAFMILATVLAAVAIATGNLGPAVGVALWIVLAISVGYAIRRPVIDGSPDPVEQVPRDARTLALAVVSSLLGLLVLVFAARVMVGAAQEVARAFGIDEAIIGATVVAVGTSIPELATSLVAVARRHYDIGIGNLIGSNLMNLTFVLGTVCFLPKPGGAGLEGHGLLLVGVMVAFTIAFVPMLMTSGRVRRREGAVLLAGYITYSWYLYF